MDVSEYLLLALRLGRLDDGLIDSYTGPDDPVRRVAAEPESDPAALAGDAARLAERVAAAGLPADRAAYLTGQLRALECAARRLAGEPIGYVAEIEAYFQVTPVLGDTDEYAAAHDELAALLPGPGALIDRYRAHRDAHLCPPDHLARVADAFAAALRAETVAAFDPPTGERVDIEVVRDQPWGAFNYYLGGFRSRIALNADVPYRVTDLAALIAHEAYPGHHTEHSIKERDLVDGLGRVEHQVSLVNTPECLIAEGLADLGLPVLVDRWGPWVGQISRDAGFPVDGDLAERVAAVTTRFDRVRQDAALLLHDRGRDPDEVEAYLCRWALTTPERARASLRFVADHRWRAYTTTYVEGRRLLGDWLADRPAGQSARDRFARLLREPLTPRSLAADLVGAA